MKDRLSGWTATSPCQTKEEKAPLGPRHAALVNKNLSSTVVAGLGGKRRSGCDNRQTVRGRSVARQRTTVRPTGAARSRRSSDPSQSRDVGEPGGRDRLAGFRRGSVRRHGSNLVDCSAIATETAEFLVLSSCRRVDCKSKREARRLMSCWTSRLSQPGAMVTLVACPGVESRQPLVSSAHL